MGVSYFLAKLKKLSIVIAAVALFAVSYTTLSVQTACEAEAQACKCNSLCVLGNGMPNALNQIYSGTISPGIDFAVEQVKAYYQVALDGLAAANEAVIAEAEANLLQWFDTFWYYNLLPALKAQTEQLTVRDVDHDKVIGTFADAREANRAGLDIAVQEVEAQREQRINENACVAATVVGGMARANVISNAYNTAAVQERLPRTSNTVGTPAARGPAADSQARWVDYTANYCDPNANAGASGCATAGPLAGRDVDVTGEIFANDTIDVRDPNQKKVIDDLAVTLIEPRAADPVPAAALSSPQGQEQMLDVQSYRARRQAAYDSYYFVVSKRVPGSDTGTFVKEIRDSAGIDGSLTAGGPGGSYNPSHNEVLDVMTNERFKTGQYAVSQIDEPENNQAELVVQQAFQAMRTNDLIELMDRYSLLLAAQVGPEVTKSHGMSNKAEARSAR
jgi:hypothetical protein